MSQDGIRTHGHAIECRINAEDPRSFAPSPGRVSALHLPGGPGVRVDTHIEPGAEVSSSYDSMIAKVIAFGADRDEALSRARSALQEMRIEGVKSNIALHRELLVDPGFAEGGVSIHHFEHWLAAQEARNA